MFGRILHYTAMIGIGLVLGVVLLSVAVTRGENWDVVQNGPWRTSLNAGNVAADPLTRAVVALTGLLALNRSETIYYTTAVDGLGAELDGACSYRIVGRDLPARWWSVTVYGADRFLIANPINRYSYNMGNLARDADGGWTVLLSPRPPPAGNWLPDPGPGPRHLALRLYNPDPTVAQAPDRVALPVIEKVSCP